METYTIARNKNESMYDFLIRTGKVLKHFFKPGEVKMILTNLQEGDVQEFTVYFKKEKHA